jgi:DNA-binding Lrp family transcriptional regulator
MRNCPWVLECFEVSGHVDYVAKVACPTLAHYDDLNNGWINDRSLQIERIESDVVLRMPKDLSVYPVELAIPVGRRPRYLAVVSNAKKTRRVAARQVDEIDLRILAALQRDGRATFKELSERVGLTARPCLERVRRLERNHVITNYAARIDLGRFASLVVAIVQLDVKQGRDSRARFEQHMCSCPQVLECFEVTGSFDYIAKVACPSVGAYQQLTEGWINDAALHVTRIESNIVLRAPKDNGLYPIGIVVPNAASLSKGAT